MDDEKLFRALADGTRRAMLVYLHRASSALTVSDLTENFEISRQAITRHLDVLQAAGLVRFSTQGRERYSYLQSKPLERIVRWLEQFDGGIQDMLRDFTGS